MSGTIGRRIMSGVAVAGGTAAIATGLALAGAGAASADNTQNTVTSNGSKFSPGSTTAAVTTPVGNAGTNFLDQLGTAISNAQIQLGTAGTNAISQTGTAVQNGQIQGGTAGTNAISQTGTAVQNGQVQVGTAGTNAISQLGQAGNGLLNGIGNLFNRG